MKNDEILTNLLTEAINGNANDLMQHCYPYVRTILRSKVPSSDIDDVAQDVLCMVMRRLGQLNGRGEKFLPWLRKLACNKAADFWRDRYRHHTEALPTFTDDLTSCQTNLSPDVEVSEDEERTRLYEALGSLPEPRQTIMRLYYLESVGTPEIAAKLNMSEQAVRRQMMNAREAIRQVFRADQ
jgi:RNA polymerase sigma factor (sigma-70 family)